MTIRVLMPGNLARLAGSERELDIEIEGSATQRAVLDAIERRFPMLAGTIRDQSTLVRRPFIRFFACGRDLSHDAPDDPLPEAVTRGEERFMVIGAMAGG